MLRSQRSRHASAWSQLAEDLRAQPIDILHLTAEQIQLDYADGKYTAVELTQAILDQIAIYEPDVQRLHHDQPQCAGRGRGDRRADGPPGTQGSAHSAFRWASRTRWTSPACPPPAARRISAASPAASTMIPDKDSPRSSRDSATRASSSSARRTFPTGRATATARPAPSPGPLNAYDITRAPGGSSGGSAVAVATGMAILATAEETGSSITNPAVRRLAGRHPPDLRPRAVDRRHAGPGHVS